MRHEKAGQEQHGHTSNDGWDDGWEPATKEEPAKADTPKPLSFRSKIGEMVVTFADRFKEKINQIDDPMIRTIATPLLPPRAAKQGGVSPTIGIIATLLPLRKVKTTSPRSVI